MNVDIVIIVSIIFEHQLIVSTTLQCLLLKEKSGLKPGASQTSKMKNFATG